MRKIRKLYYFDRNNTREMISFLNNSANDKYINHVMFNPFIPLHHLLPLKLKYLPESFVLKDGKEIKGLITVEPYNSLNKKVEIKKLFFEENQFEDAADLVQYVVSKYKAMGAVSVIVKVDDYLPNLLTMFVSKCGFSQMSYEKLWHVTKIPDADYDKREFRHFRNSDAQIVTNMYNEALFSNFRPLLGKEVGEYREGLFSGLSYFSEYKYIIQDKKTENVTGCVIIKTSDNVNYMLDIIQSSWVDLDVNSIISFAVDKIKHRNKKFGLYVKSKRYLNMGEKYEAIFAQNGYECVQNQVVLTNSSLRTIKAAETSGRYTVLSDFCPSNMMPT